MIQNVLQKIGGIGNYGVISIVLFFGVFALVTIWALAQRKALLDSLSMLPLEEEDKETAQAKSRASGERAERATTQFPGEKRA